MNLIYYLRHLCFTFIFNAAIWKAVVQETSTEASSTDLFLLSEVRNDKLGGYDDFRGYMFNFHCNYITTLKAKYFNGCLVIISTLVVVDYCFMGWD